MNTIRNLGSLRSVFFTVSLLSVLSGFAETQSSNSNLAQAAAAPKLPFSSIRIAGDTAYVAGTSAAPGKAKQGSIEDLTQQVIENIQAILATEKLTLNDVVKTTVFLTDMNDFQAMSKVYAKMFAGNSQYPARTTIGVQSLPFGAPIEIECIAYIGK